MASFFSDHNVVSDLVSELRRRGHTVLTAQEARLDRAADQEILHLCGSQGLLIITGDGDFADLHRLGAIRRAGVLLIRPPAVERPQDRGRIMADAVERLLASDPPLRDCLYHYTGAEWKSEGNQPAPTE